MADNEAQVLTDPNGGTPDAETQEKVDYVASLPPGSLIGTNWSKKPELELKESHINAIKALIKDLMKRDMPARREEILRVWEARLFWRGYQHLLPSRVGFGWEFAAPGSGYGLGEAGCQSMFETNFYATYGNSVVSALTRQVPKPIFNAVCAKEDADVTAASAATKLVDTIKRHNNILSIMADMARLLWTDGRAEFFTRYVKDKQRFGSGDPEEPENPEEAAAGVKPKKPKGGEPRGMTVISVTGALEVKRPMKANSQAECGWLIYADEYDLPNAKGMYPKKADKIVVNQGGPAGDDIDRLARVNVKLGVQDNFITSDSEAYDVTVQHAWLRDCALLEIKDQQIKEELLEMVDGNGLRATFCGDQFIEAKQESMDDHWTLCFANTGDGIHRNALGTSYIPIQKQVNTYLELRHDYLVRGVGMSYMDNDMFDVEHIKDQDNTPGGVRPVQADPVRPISDFVYKEPNLVYPVGLSEAIEDFGKGHTAQIITGVFPALSGDDAGSAAETLGVMKLQRDAALGRIGIPWRYIKEATSNVFMQAVQNLAQNHDENIFINSPRPGSDTIVVELQDLKGKFYCSPSTDENFPESWSEIQNRVEDLYAASQADAELGKIVNHPQNAPFIKKAMGLTELFVPTQESADKQLGEIEDLKRGKPLPNKKYIELQKQVQKGEALLEQAPDPQSKQMGEQALAPLKQQLEQTPQEVSSVEVDEKVDDHDTEAEVCLTFMRSPAGRALKADTSEVEEGEPTGEEQYANIRLHYLEHAAIVEKLAAGKQKEPQKGVTKSVNLKDLLAAGMTDEAGQLLGEANIKSAGKPAAPPAQ